MMRFSTITMLVLLLLPASLTAQADAEGQALKALSLEDYGPWSRITEVALSPDGKWMTYAYSPNDGDTRFFWRKLNSLEALPADTVMNGSGAAFSPDSRWLAFLSSPPEKEAERLREQQKPVPRTLRMVELGEGDVFEMEDVASFVFSEDSRWVAIQAPQTSSRMKFVRRMATSATMNPQPLH